MNKLIEQKLVLADLTMQIGKLIRQKWAIQRQLVEIQNQETVLLAEIATESERLENGGVKTDTGQAV